jgi:hypothetical protein
MSLLSGCATGRTYKTDRFEAPIGDAARVEEEPGPKGNRWKFLDASGRQFLGASVYSVAGDPTFPCGLPSHELDGAAAFLVRRTLGRVRVASVIVPQDDGSVLDFSYEESEPRARDVVARVGIRHARRGEPIPCETLRTGGSLKGDRYDAGLFSAKLLQGAWLLDSRHFRSEDRDSPGGGWHFEDGSTGEVFLSVRGYPRNPRIPRRCDSGPLVELDGTCARRCRDTDGLEPYPGPSNVTLSLEVSTEKGDEYVLEFGYDEHGPAAGLARATLESVEIRSPGSAACARGSSR